MLYESNTSVSIETSVSDGTTNNAELYLPTFALRDAFKDKLVYFCDGFYFAQRGMIPVTDNPFTIDFTDMEEENHQYMAVVMPKESLIRVLNKGEDDMPLFFQDTAELE